MNNLPRYWALVDIETTGARATHDAITEIAVKILDETEEVASWQSLIQPHMRIPPRIQALTGISNEMVEEAPRFDEIADTLYGLLEEPLFVAHNARFDYAFIKNAFERLGMTFQKKVLCTVKLSRKLFPEYRRHSMDALMERHGLATDHRHRAMGDVELMHQFILHCTKQFGLEILIDQVAKITKTSSIPSHLETEVNDIPNTPGVYLFYDEDKSTPLYIGKSVNLRTRVMSHFSSDHKQNKELAISRKIHHIEWIETAGELGALLLESRLIKEKIPVFNRRLRRNKTLAGYRLDKSGPYTRIIIERNGAESHHPGPTLFGSFRSVKHATETLVELVELHRLCPKLCGLEKSRGACFSYHLKRCKGACIEEENPTLYNLKLEMALKQFATPTWIFKGPIGIKEQCEANGLACIHVIDNWRHLGTVTCLEEIPSLFDNPEYSKHTLDEMKLIQSYIRRTCQSDQLISLEGWRETIGEEF